ncbi:hypothetical protein QO034_13475 [Sedimentitalea sp. JM2-8]|uniref:Seryl-tRNA synthetase n=1 Tax=Sedimentitalea xiamensis TaxID=3050037 RepID=A0ABT7FGB8_9RHOB|nr:hypothetical protein [Sedimentitalea xiamensis]MDK3074127.1 hypothetical protein [Sedimentitalea xiamensis]
MTGHPTPFMAALVLLAAAAFAASPLLVPGFGGFEPDQFPVPQVDAPVQPAGYAFAIWGVIYGWLLIGAGFGFFARARAVDWQPMRAPLALSLGAGAAWLPVALISPLGATVLIWVMLVSALMALRAAPVLDRWLGRAPVALYAGWLTAASAVSVGLVLAGWGVTGQIAAAAIALLIAAAIGLFVLRRVPDVPEYAAALVWALAAVVVANLTQSLTVLVLAGAAAALISAVALAKLVR